MDKEKKDFKGAEFPIHRETNLSWLAFQGVNLTGINLTGANLDKANLSHANLSHANLRHADLSGAKFDENTKWPKGIGVIEEIDLTGTTMEKTHEEDLIGTTWKINYSDGDVTLIKFHKLHNLRLQDWKRCSYKNIKSASGNEGVSYSVDIANCNWKINSNLVTWEFRGGNVGCCFMVYTAIINENKMMGNFISAYNGGVQGTFIGTKINAFGIN